MATWRKELTDAMSSHSEGWADVVDYTLTDEQLDFEFSTGYGVYDGAPFTLWTDIRVYFPWGYDGAEGVASVSRVPDGLATDHIGGGG